MARPAKKFFYIYKTTNLINGKFYIGMHSTSNLKDSYLGSGKRLRHSIRKYGKENFKLEILEFLPDLSSLKEREKQLVNEDLLKDPMCMNLVYGGGGGFISPAGCKLGGIVAGKILVDRIKTDYEFSQKLKGIASERWKSLWANGVFEYVDYWTGRKHTNETKSKMSEKAKLRTGELNTQYGTCWITNGTINKKMKKTDSLPDGFQFGRIL